MNSHQQQSQSPNAPASGWLWRGVLVVLTLVLTGAVMANYLDWRDNRDSLLETLASARVDDFNESAIQRIQYETGAHHAQTLAARALVHQVMNFDAETAEGLPELSRQEQIRGLETAEELAKNALRSQPNDWQASMLLGASRYLNWSIRQDRRLFSRAAAWEAPLLRAVETSEGKVQSRRLLAAAYLETWWALSEEKKNFAKELLRTTFLQDKQAFVRLAPLWLEAASTQEEAFSLIPNTPSAWQYLATHYRRLGEDRSVARVHHRHLLAIERRLEEKLEEVAQRIELGDLVGARTVCLEVVALAPPQARFAPSVTRALELYPPGLHRLHSANPLMDWMRFALHLDLQGRSVLSPAAVNHLSDLLEDLENPLHFHAALLGKDTQRLRDVKNRLQPTRPWTPFLLAQARRQIAAGDLDAANGSLSRIDPISKRLLLYNHMRHKFAVVDGEPTAISYAEKALAPFYRSEWSSLDWEGDTQESRLFFLPAAESSGLRLGIARAPDQGGVLEILLDGALVDVRAVRRKRRYVVQVPISEGLHLLEIRSHAGEQISAGPVELL